jgi:hypothetical protein
MQTYILSNNVLSDNILQVADEGKIFKGGYKAIIKEYYFKNAWSDKEEIIRFRKLEKAKKYIAKYYKQIDIENLITDQ